MGIRVESSKRGSLTSPKWNWNSARSRNLANEMISEIARDHAEVGTGIVEKGRTSSVPQTSTNDVAIHDSLEDIYGSSVSG